MGEAHCRCLHTVRVRATGKFHATVGVSTVDMVLPSPHQPISLKVLKKITTMEITNIVGVAILVWCVSAVLLNLITDHSKNGKYSTVFWATVVSFAVSLILL